MPVSKIQNEQEVLRWFEEGRTYEWMVEEYLRKYNIQTGITMWANFRRRRGLPRRIVRDDTLIPWEVKAEHRWSYDLQMLRMEARKRAGEKLTHAYEGRLARWLTDLEEAGAVLHYDPDTEEGFHWVSREKTDDDIIRRPRSGLTSRRNAD